MSPPVLELLAWVSRRPRTYAEAMEAWRTTCPRHSAWEDALLDGLIVVTESEDARQPSMVAVTGRGRAVLETTSRSNSETFPL
ncbi:MAG TPA: hypothetical protein VNV82_07090 [Bryobacteraceae bacterium]|nr:hypothetical protein [Bryobacteraceae bacterium]